MRWNNFIVNIALPCKEALVESIAVHYQPAERAILQTRDKRFGFSAQASQSLASTDMDHIYMRRSGAGQIGLKAFLPGQHAIQGCQTHSCSFIGIAAQF